VWELVTGIKSALGIGDGIQGLLVALRSLLKLYVTLTFTDPAMPRERRAAIFAVGFSRMLMTLMSHDSDLWFPASSVNSGDESLGPVRVTSTENPPVPRAPTPGVYFVTGRRGTAARTVKPVVAVPPAVVRVTSRAAECAASGAPDGKKWP
jgi:hypothetical protein